jgi:hypothetical protein
MTLAQKAAFFEDEIEKRPQAHAVRYVLGVTLERPGDVSRYAQKDSDNDGCGPRCTARRSASPGRHAAAEARERAVRAFEALRFLGTVTQAAHIRRRPASWRARCCRRTAGSQRDDSPERDATMRKRDRFWKSIAPRWPKSADGRWYWKSDTSSDELDGHFFFYGVYNDLVVSSDDERQALRAHVGAWPTTARERLPVDRPRRQADALGVFDPQSLNHDPQWRDERGLNSMSMLSYLKLPSASPARRATRTRTAA